MDVTFHRLGGGRYFTTAVRDDGVTVEIPGYDRTVGIPHDLAHFVAEREFGMTRGLWGSVAAGALFANMVVRSGRRRPHAAERSTLIRKAHAEDIALSEAVAGAIHEAVEHDLTPDAVLDRLRAHAGIVSPAPPQVAVIDVEGAAAALRREADRWAALPEAGELTLIWPFRPERVAVPRPDRSRGGRLPSHGRPH